MYNLQVANMGWMAILFSISVVLLGSFLLLNVILAVLADALRTSDEIDKNKQEKILMEVNKSVKRYQRQNNMEVEGFVEQKTKVKRKTEMISNIKQKQIEIAVLPGTGNSKSNINDEEMSSSSEGN